MLQIVPSVLEVQPEPVPITPSEAEIKAKEKLNAEAIMKQKNAERRVEREKRRLAREKKRKEKEQKRKERENRRKMKFDENADLIKRALQLEIEGAASLGEEDNQELEEELPIHWPPIPIVVSNTTKPAGKGILLTDGFR